MTSATTTFTIIQNFVVSGGFESSTGWSTTAGGGGGYSVIQDNDNSIPKHSGIFAELDTAISTDTEYSTLTNTFGPVPISSISNTMGSFSIWIYNTGYFTQHGYASIQFQIRASDGTQLIYWWGNAPSTAPTETSATKVYNMGTLPGIFTVRQWVQFSRNLQADWTNKGLSSSANLNSFVIRCDALSSGGYEYGQEIFVDDVVIH